uniref:Uncharacterized protein n=1 Tax=Cucumis melo TaxID=3656 RepID=A0A9I9CZV3_CUCME
MGLSYKKAHLLLRSVRSFTHHSATCAGGGGEVYRNAEGGGGDRNRKAAGGLGGGSFEDLEKSFAGGGGERKRNAAGGLGGGGEGRRYAALEDCFSSGNVTRAAWTKE